MRRPLPRAVWPLLAAAMAAPIVGAAASPLLQWREAIYVAAGMAGVVGLSLMLAQPLLMSRRLPGLSVRRATRLHRWTGSALIGCVLLHVTGLWITSPPDVVDALLFRSPTPFSAWGVAAMWALFAAGLMVLLKKRLPVSPLRWRIVHSVLAVIIVTGTVVHALLIEGAMETVTKVAVCALALCATAAVLAGRKVWKRGRSAR